MTDPIAEPRYALYVTRRQLDDLKSMLEAVSSGEGDPDDEVFDLLDLVRAVRREAFKSSLQHQERDAEVLTRKEPPLCP